MFIGNVQVGAKEENELPTRVEPVGFRLLSSGSMTMDVLTLSRWQFGITTVYHFLFVPLTIGLAFLVAVMQTIHYRTGNEIYHQMTRFFGKLFVILFTLGVVTGRFRLNGYSFEAYEREGENGSKQFRLVSSAKVNPEREAACIRYMVNEGLIEDLWPEMSKKIKEEADWAFLPE
jgi:hypothetical protein